MTDSSTLIMNESVQQNGVIMEQWLKSDQRSAVRLKIRLNNFLPWALKTVPQTSSYSHIKEDCVSHESKTKHKKRSSVTGKHYSLR